MIRLDSSVSLFVEDEKAASDLEAQLQKGVLTFEVMTIAAQTSYVARPTYKLVVMKSFEPGQFLQIAEGILDG